MKILREPLFHFLILGAALFVIFSMMGKWVVKEQITVTPEQIEARIKGFNADYKRPPTTQEVETLIEDYVREEVLLRKGWDEKRGREDPTIRAKMRQIVEIQDLAAAGSEIADPTDDQLSAFLQQHPEIFRKTNGEMPALDDVRDTARSVWLASQRKASIDAAYRKLRDQYDIVIHRPAPPASSPATRTAEAR